MISIVIHDSGEPKVIQLTYENLWREIKDIPGAELLVSDDWLAPISRIKNQYVCFVEADCLVNSGYFSSQLGLFKKNSHFRKLAMLAATTGVNQFGNRFFGYTLGNNYADGIMPVREKKSSVLYPVQIGFMPGAIFRTGMLHQALSSLKPASNKLDEHLVQFSTDISLEIWKQGGRVHINPNATYVTTQDYVNDIGKFKHDGADLASMFKQESI